MRRCAAGFTDPEPEKFRSAFTKTSACYPISAGSKHSNSNFLVSQLYYLDRSCVSSSTAAEGRRTSEQHYLLVEELDATWTEMLRDDFGMANVSAPARATGNLRSQSVSAEQDQADELSASEMRFVRECMYPHDHALHTRLKALVNIKRELAALPQTRDALLGLVRLRRDTPDSWVSPPPPPETTRQKELNEAYGVNKDGPLMGLALGLVPSPPPSPSPASLPTSRPGRGSIAHLVLTRNGTNRGSGKVGWLG